MRISQVGEVWGYPRGYIGSEEGVGGGKRREGLCLYQSYLII